MNEQEILCFADIQAEEVKWLWYPYIPYGKITILQGDPGCGKTMAVLSLAALLSKGESLPFEEAAREPINILYQTSEDGIADTIKPRLESAGANCTRIKIINEEKRALTFDDPRLEQSILQENARLLILDPLSAYIGPTVSMNQANEVRGAFRSLYAMAQRTKCAVLIVAHMNKMSGISALYRTSGSIDIAGAVRSILTVTRYQRSPTQRVLVPVKSNLAAAGPALLFLPRILRKMGYEVDFNPNHKYPTIKMPHDRRAVRFKTLGEEYTPQAMAQRIQQNHAMGIFKRMEIYNKRYPPVHPHYQKLRQDFRKAIMEAFGIYRTYLYYCYLLGKLPTTTPNYRPPHPAMREDYRRWAEIERQLHLLERHSLNTTEDVAAFTSEQEQKLTDLEARRTKCRNRLRRCRDPAECEALHTEKDELTKQLTETRKELHTAQQIPARVKRMRENIQLLNDREQQRVAHQKER